jgi:hypothetical protein
VARIQEITSQQVLGYRHHNLTSKERDDKSILSKFVINYDTNLFTYVRASLLI